MINATAAGQLQHVPLPDRGSVFRRYLQCVGVVVHTVARHIGVVQEVTFEYGKLSPHVRVPPVLPLLEC